MRIGAAATEMATDRGPHVLGGGIGRALQEFGAAHHYSRRAKPALHGIVLNEGGLYRVELVTICQTFDGRYATCADIDG